MRIKSSRMTNSVTTLTCDRRLPSCPLSRRTCRTGQNGDEAHRPAEVRAVSPFFESIGERLGHVAEDSYSRRQWPKHQIRGKTNESYH